ncbi:NAD-dependent epimerase/dehydratase family protein [Microbulbifer thermotolerans]|uniref:NAD-dependent epimerase/dehydratase family protein n=1 Tax=Microbulbifer thermotolerans TaxID=252514 RepID=A0AB35HZE9_MICTH|nr:NAD-dependent epimerase/dehydratase family protein [Microbulbifer thermotolerans]MCX2781237.1 NAD-dependent epimerase/dehydratase family protein [Microbulbifer thermotolerans]MCX2783430.1 NAD-dependent epimerase/dehydratase family protein [Microbulbifer thermotolerans]MCX2793464.1 NAD-dependent epimerase/dehydratase family protein [Microbulbifer thermotolerans]MCX2802884.1 NAD-dependent epimerase/dehydratase family protein [Microbulbifer thermotolerans]MCX2803734.1 NAD-dependent epimerase/d
MRDVLVTGGTGFIASYCVVELLKNNYRVRVTFRDRSGVEYIRGMLIAAGISDLSKLSFHFADLRYDKGWQKALDGVTYVLHVASPFPSKSVDKEEIIGTACNGTLRLLKYAQAASVKRVVLTSSFGAIGYGHPKGKDLYSENDWTNLDNSKLSPYIRSKTLSEKRAWEYINSSGGDLEISVINPVGVFGPPLGKRLSSSIMLIQMLIKGRVKAIPKIHIGVVDVRDLAVLHLLVMESTVAANKRFIASANTGIPLIELATILYREIGAQASKVPYRQLPNWLLKIMAIFSESLKDTASEAGKKKCIDSSRAKGLLGWETRSVHQTIRDTADRLFEMGLV